MEICPQEKYTRLTGRIKNRYITERITKDPANAITFAAALTSLIMESPGPFTKTRQDVEAFKREVYL